MKKKKYSSKVRRRRNIGTVDDLRSFLTSLKDMSIADSISQVRQKKIRFLRRCTVIDKFKELPLDKQKLILDWGDYVKINNSPKTQKKNKKRLYFEINFIHKEIQEINLRRILNEVDVKQMIPARCKFKELPIIYFKYCKNISQSILNYNAATKASTFESFEEIQNLVCHCGEEDVAAFIDPIHGHVLTGDLGIVQNLELRDVMSKGAKFRETPRLSHSQIEASLFQDLEKFKEKWSDKERFENELDPWISLVRRKIRDKLKNMPSVSKGRSVLEKTQVKEELNRLKSRYIITVVDKAANNFAFQCQKFYFLRAATELGLNNLQGNATYAVVGDRDNVIINIKTEMEQKFRIETNVQEFPVIFWQPKFHKNPVKFRGIAGSRDKILSPLEKLVGKMMKHISNHFRNYCGTAERLSSFRHFFIIKNSGEMLRTLHKLKGNAVTFDSFDFSNLYTNFRHEEIIERLSWLVDLMFHNSGKQYISVSKNYHKTEYTDIPLNVNQGWSFTCLQLKEAIEFLIKNTYIEFGLFFLRQICGIPMGSIPAPDFANLCLSVDEFRFIKSNITLKNYALLTKMNNIARYLDDIGACNFTDFDNIAVLIYSDSLTLNRSNETDSTTSVAYLDLSISVIDREFVVKVYCKTDDYNFEVITLPFLESNVADEMCYYVYFGQILRFLRICSKLSDFKLRSVFLTRLLQRRGYFNGKLARKFMDVLFRYKEDLVKFAYVGNVRLLMQEVIYENIV